MIRTIVVILISLISIITSKHYLVEMEEKEDRQEEGSDYSVSRSFQLQDECGRSNRDSTRIVGGSNVLRNEFPWHVRLSMPGFKAPCGGSVLSREKILTAAHCTLRFSAQNITVWTSDHDFTRKGGELSHAVCSKTEHPDYNKKAKYDQDIAVLHLCQPLMFTDGKFSKYFSPKPD